MSVIVYTGGASVVVIHSQPPAQPLPVVDSFTATPNNFTVGASTTLAWTTHNVDSVLIDNGVGTQPVNGSLVVTPGVSVSYNLTATGSGGSATANVAVTVNPVVVPTGKRPVLGSARLHQQQGWQADWIDAALVDGRALPWTLGADLPNGILAFSKNGVAPTAVQAWHVWGNPGELYSEIPFFDLKGRSHPYNSEIADDFAQIVTGIAALPPSDGPRGLAMPISLVTAIPHPTYTLSGNIIPRHPLVIWIRHDAMMQLGYADGSMDNLGFIPSIVHSHDACIDGRFIIYVCDLGTKNAAGVWSGGRIARVDRQPGGVGIGGTPAENTALYDVTTIATAGYPTAVRVDENHNVYFIDMDAGGVVKKVMGGVGAATTLCTVPGAFAMDYALGKLYIMCNTGEVHIVNATTGVVGPNLMPSNWVFAPAVRGGDFFTISVDAKGTCGPIGAFSCSRVHTTANTNVWQFSADGATVLFGNSIYNSGHTYLTVGRADNVHELFGHYDWLGGKYHVDQAVRFVGGYANTPTGVLVMDPPYPVQPTLDYTALWLGMRTICRGGVLDDRSKPSLCCQMSREGWSMFAKCSNDEIAEMPYDAQEAWIQDGYAGSFPRPDITGDYLYCVMLHHLSNSQRWIREGNAAYLAFRAWWTSKGRAFPPVPAIPFNQAGGPFINDGMTAHKDGNGIDYHLEVRELAQDSGTYRVGIFGNGSGDTKYSNALEYTNTAGVGPLPADAVIIVDKGMPSQKTMPATLAPGWHAFTVQASGWATNAVTYRVP